MCNNVIFCVCVLKDLVVVVLGNYHMCNMYMYGPAIFLFIICFAFYIHLFQFILESFHLYILMS